MGVRTARVESITWAWRTARVTGIPGDVPIARHIPQAGGGLLVGDTVVVLVEGGQAWIIGVLGEAPPPPPPPPPPDEETPTPPAPVPEPEERTISLRPTWSGTRRGGGWRGDTSDLYQGDWTGRGINAGACWWGRLPDRIIAARVTLTRLPGAGLASAQTPRITLLAGTSRPAGTATELASTAGPALRPGQSVTWQLPEAWLTRLNNGSAGGLGITSQGARSPYLGLSASGLGMTLAMTTLTAG